MFFVLGLLEKEGTCVAEFFTIVPKRLMIQLYEKRTLQLTTQDQSSWK